MTVVEVSQDLGRVYGAKSAAESREAYRNWANEYDADTLKQGFRLPGMAAAFVARSLRRTPCPAA